MSNDSLKLTKHYMIVTPHCVEELSPDARASWAQELFKDKHFLETHLRFLDDMGITDSAAESPSFESAEEVVSTFRSRHLLDRQIRCLGMLKDLRGRLGKLR